jgi:hypothetical protein
MEKTVFDACFEKWNGPKNKENKSWDTLAEQFYFGSGEKLRDKFRKELKKQGISKKNNEKFEKDGHDSPKIIVCDIETLPGVGYFWSIWDQNIGLEQIISDVCLLGWAGKFLNEPEMYSDILLPKEAIKKDDKRLTKSCWDFLSQADVVIGHNFSSFDAKSINTAFLQYDLPPLKFITIDTLMIAKQNFRFSSNKLKFINKKLGIRDKMDNDGFLLWKSCHEGDPVALQTMKEYNEGDIIATEELFYKLRPYIRNFNISLYNDIIEYQCPVCGSTNLNIEGYYYTGNAGKYESVRCLDCKCVSRKKNNLLTKDKRKNLLINS